MCYPPSLQKLSKLLLVQKQVYFYFSCEEVSRKTAKRVGDQDDILPVIVSCPAIHAPGGDETTFLVYLSASTCLLNTMPRIGPSAGARGGDQEVSGAWLGNRDHVVTYASVVMSRGDTWHVAVKCMSWFWPPEGPRKGGAHYLHLLLSDRSRL